MEINLVELHIAVKTMQRMCAGGGGGGGGEYSLWKKIFNVVNISKVTERTDLKAAKSVM